MAHLGNKMNDYALLMGSDYDKIPKSVFAAIAVSFALMHNEENFDTASDIVIGEWDTLNKNGIVPQKALQKKEGS